VLYGDKVFYRLNGVEEIWYEKEGGNYRYILPLSNTWDTMDDNDSDPTTEEEANDGVLSIGQSINEMYLLDFVGGVATVNGEQIVLINLAIRHYTLVTKIDGILVRRAVKTTKDFVDRPTAACRIFESLQHAEELILRRHAAQTQSQDPQPASPPAPPTPEPPRATVPAHAPTPTVTPPDSPAAARHNKPPRYTGDKHRPARTRYGKSHNPD
jgi:hypothetical protein